MILGIGTDILDARRLERPLMQHQDRFINRILTMKEISYLHQKHPKISFSHSGFLLTFGKLFAAKEALVKALGTGFRGGITFQHIDISRNHMGRPSITLAEKADLAFKRLLPNGMNGAIHLSLSDEFPYIQAFVIMSSF